MSITEGIMIHLKVRLMNQSEDPTEWDNDETEQVNWINNQI